MQNFDLENIKSHPSQSLAKANASRDLQINFNQAEDPLMISTKSRGENKYGSATQSGRSMIEMLGVLAIIGVLSVGGIAGYSKAMQKYRINKAIEQITLISGNIRSFFAPQRNYEGLGGCVNDNDYCKLIKKAKLMPDEMWDDTDKKFKNVFGYYVNLQNAHKSSNTDNQAFMISYGIPADYELCIELLFHDWTNVGLKGVTMTHAQYYKLLTISDNTENALATCTYIVEKAKSYGSFGIYFYFDVNSNCWNETNGNTCS